MSEFSAHGLSGARVDRIATRAVSNVIDALDLVILTIGLANAWHLSARELLSSRGEDPADPDRIAAHRAAVIEPLRCITNVA